MSLRVVLIIIESHPFFKRKIHRQTAQSRYIKFPQMVGNAMILRSKSSRRSSAAAMVPLPILGNIEAPLELEVLLLVIVDKARDGIVMPTGQHSRGSLLLLDCIAAVSIHWQMKLV